MLLALLGEEERQVCVRVSSVRQQQQQQQPARVLAALNPDAPFTLALLLKVPAAYKYQTLAAAAEATDTTVPSPEFALPAHVSGVPA